MKNRLQKAVPLLISTVIAAFSFAGCSDAGLTPEKADKPDVLSVNAAVLSALDLMSGNPVLPVPTADPDIIYANGKYYIYPTATGPNASQFHAYSSTDLLNWTDEGIVLDLANVS